MTDILERIASRANDAPLPTEYLLDEAGAEIERLRTVLTEITNQKTASEIHEECGDDFSGDFEYGYDAIIRIARAALSSTECETP